MKYKWKLCSLMSVGIAINYLDRVNISHLIVPISEDLSLDPVAQGFILSAFSWGYVVFMLAGGVLVDRVGPRKIAAYAAGSWSVMTALSGAVASAPTLILTRFFVGASEAPIFPANARMVREEFSITERGRATALFDSGSYIGTAIAAPIVVYSSIAFGWRAAFIACGLLGVAWVVVWLRFTRAHATETYSESKTETHTNWNIVFSLLRNRKMLGASFGFFSYNYAKSFYLTWFPSYLIIEEGFSYISVGYAAMLPPIFAIFGNLSAGYATDRMIMKGISLNVARKLPLILGLVLSGTVVFAEAFDSKWMVLAILSFSFASTIAASASIWAIPGDIAPSSNLVGTVGGIQNTFSNCAGIIAPIVTGILFSVTGTFTAPLVLTACLAILGALCYWFVVGDLEPIEIK